MMLDKLKHLSPLSRRKENPGKFAVQRTALLFAAALLATVVAGPANAEEPTHEIGVDCAEVYPEENEETVGMVENEEGEKFFFLLKSADGEIINKTCKEAMLKRIQELERRLSGEIFPEEGLDLFGPPPYQPEEPEDQTSPPGEFLETIPYSPPSHFSPSLPFTQGI